MAITQMAATDTGKALPCFDEPELKATFTISILRKNPMISLTNMPLSTSISMYVVLSHPLVLLFWWCGGGVEIGFESGTIIF